MTQNRCLYLKRFSANRGFPFDVAAPDNAAPTRMPDRAELERSVKTAVADLNNTGHTNSFIWPAEKPGALVTGKYSSVDEI